MSASETLLQSVVVFSRNYLPITKVNLRRAIILLVTDKAEPVDFSSGAFWEVRSPSLILQVPAQIRLKMQGAERVWKVPRVTRREVLKRDKHQCQYCGSKKQLTLDHIIPRSKGGKHSWDNVVIACSSCNSHKGDRTPAQAGIELRTKPLPPVHPTVAFAEQFWREHKLE